MIPILYRVELRHLGIEWKSRCRFRKSRVDYYNNSDAAFNLVYLQMCGDINPNPGPTSPLFDTLHMVRDKGKHGISIGHSKILIEHTNLDILTVSETHLTQDIHNDEVNIDGYQILRKDRAHKAGGGVAIYFKSALDCTWLSKYDDEDIETIWIELLSHS